jgi:hypothetical protein
MADQFELDHSDSDVMRALASIGAAPFAYRTLGSVFEGVPELALIAAPVRRAVAGPPAIGRAVSVATPVGSTWLSRLLAREGSADPPAPVRAAQWLTSALSGAAYRDIEAPSTGAAIDRPMADILL